MEFSGFTPADFDAYRQHKWASNAYNLERLQVKQKLEAMGRRITPLLCAADGSPLACELSSEHPTIFNQHRVNNQHLFFSRSVESRRELESIINRGRTIASLVQDPSPLRSHVFLCLMLDAVQVEVALKLHSDASVDRENLQRRCQDFFQREKIVNLVRDLPAGFSVGLAGQSLRAVGELDQTALATLVAELSGANTWLCFSHATPSEVVVAQGREFLDTALAELSALLPLLHLVAWRRDNDYVAIRETLREKDVKQRTKGIQKNDRVRVVRGVFAGKVGQVQTVDGKGGVKVLLGTMLIKLEGEDIAPV